MAKSNKINVKAEDFPYKKLPVWDDGICSLLFQQVKKPSHYMMCRAINVYDNKYRINVYTKHEEEGLTKQRISNSYFAKLTETGSLEILMGNEPVDPKAKKKTW